MTTTTSTPNKGASLLKFYLLLISFGSVVGIIVCLGIVMYQSIAKTWITDEEYIQKDHYYELQNCENGYNSYYTKPVLTENNTGDTKPTKEEVDKCKSEQKINLTTRRNIEYKDSMIGSIVRGVIFIIVFSLHFPFFLRKEKQVSN